MNQMIRIAVGAVLAGTLGANAHAFDLKGMADKATKAVDDANKAVSEQTDKANGAINAASEQGQANLDQVTGQWQVAGDAKNMVDTLSSDLGVSQAQAAGGSAALLALAQTKLDASQFSGVTDKVSGLDQMLGNSQESSGLLGSVLGNVKSLQGVQTAFSAMGLSPDMVSQFAPTMLKFLGGQGVADGVLGSLQQLWTPAG
ncbi:DUF2780 domain-containing protein [Alloalcanivorax xenomutans]|jgi:uncharacterized protein VcgC/VcgE DUF2780|uniref:DUF2780 domain-containing protein n=1 Tax=Alloalcanivorax xenomutans TaxID=1094342 RepID=A0A9Q3W3V9_9GAMM|nr:DUF2780 domain-containing protein [Alloalcanivorax xenomutans]ERS09529.1 hypothetical protein Q668_05305 [Alcanivorax sp. PN-3]KYZ85814.1 hypothetical protein A3Q32_06340 [Alcanivorax sp. KX64203]MBA4719614.1 DUF2780 domain-containing protein [Alcanivorax sp.]MCE7507342.1 DUF2780 domain-containing protein [Alloalcanivorax xenomutans]MCE7522865.1 DUF2780 domain-containing protein [Alloalcanivorax xenomutans]|tara:strand:+ start:708 stop:1310 length:603 start_codon:yes stop_codon:yes gene_type:complete